VLTLVHSPTEVLSFCSDISVEGVPGSEILLRTWTEAFDDLQGLGEIRLSVVALSRIFDSGIQGILVKGDEIVDLSAAERIVTRSQRRKSMPIILPC
jgi:hypothetical protein